MRRKWLYKKNVEPTIFKGEEAIQEALNNGWETRPIGSVKKEDIEAEVITKKKNPKKVKTDDTSEETLKPSLLDE